MDKPSSLDNSLEPSVRQRHLYNLRSIFVKNVCPKYVIENFTDLCKHSFYFTLHENFKSPAYYTSTKVSGTLNPVWEKVNFRKDNCLHLTDLRKEFVCVRVWMKIENEEPVEENVKEVIVRWDVDFSALIPIEKEHLIYGSNVILFEFDNGLFTAPFKDKVSCPFRNPTEEINLLNTRTSYRLNSLKRLQLTLRAITEVNKKSEEVKSIISAILNRREKFEGQKEEVERLRCRIDTMKGELAKTCLSLQNTQRLFDSQCSSNEIDDIALKENYNNLSSSWQRLHESKKSYFDVRDQLIQTGAHLVKRRKQLLTDMASIYPITKDPAKDKYYIAGVHLPKSEELSGQDEVMLGVALGFTCHLVRLIALFLDVPLRYPISHRGSRSTIRDDIIDVLSDKERDFPLFAKGKERYQFEYAVYILNKNIVQLRHYCGMSTSSLGSTLFNLYTLLNDKLGVVKTSRSNAFASQHVLVPPSFGGPLPEVTASGSRIDPVESNPGEPSASTTPMISSPVVSINPPSSSLMRAHGAEATSTNQNSCASSVDAFPASSSSPIASKMILARAGPSSRVRNAASELTSTRSLSPSVESLTSSHESRGFLSRKFRALKIFRTSSSASMSSSPAANNSKFHLLSTPESGEWQEMPDSYESSSGFVIINAIPAQNDDESERSPRDVRGDVPSKQAADASITDATLNEVLTRLDDIVKISEDQDSNDVQLTSRCDWDPSADIRDGASDEAGARGDLFLGSLGRAPAGPSAAARSTPTVFKTLMTNIVETPDNCLSSEDEVPLDS